MFDRFFLSERSLKLTLTTGALLILGIPVGIAVFVLGYFIGENPCIMCWDERAGMIFIGLLMFFMLRWGMKTKYLVAYAIWSFFGLYMAARHCGNLVWRDLGQGFGNAIFGAHTYAWALFVYWVAVLSLGLIFLFIRKGSVAAKDLSEGVKASKPFSSYTNAVIALSFVVIIANVFQALIEIGLPPFTAIGRPARLTLDIPKAVKAWNYSSFWGKIGKVPALRGPWDIEKPYLAGVNEKVSMAFDKDVSKGPVVPSKDEIRLLATYKLPFKPEGFFGRGVTTGIAFNETLNRFGFVTSNAGFYWTDVNFKTVTDHAVLDYPNGNDLVKTTDAVFAGEKLIGLAYNKTIYAAELKSTDSIDPWMQWRIFREATPNVAPVWGVNRPWLSSSRAHLSYVTAAAYDRTADELHLIAVPNNYNPNSILLTFDMKDMTVVSERNLRPAEGAANQTQEQLSAYYITGAVLWKGKLIAVSKNHHSLLVINPDTAKIEKAIALPNELHDPHSLTVANGRFFVLDRIDDLDVVREFEMLSL